MFTKILRVETNSVMIPGLDKFKGKTVEIIIREKKGYKIGYEREFKINRLEKFFSLCGNISIDYSEIENLRESSYI